MAVLTDVTSRTKCEQGFSCGFWMNGEHDAETSAVCPCKHWQMDRQTYASLWKQRWNWCEFLHWREAAQSLEDPKTVNNFFSISTYRTLWSQARTLTISQATTTNIQLLAFSSFETGFPEPRVLGKRKAKGSNTGMSSLRNTGNET